MNHSPARLLMERADALAQLTDEPGRLTRLFASPAMRRANDLVGRWMKDAGLSVREDAICNLIGTLPGRGEVRRALLLGSHLDTVRDAGRWDGPLGVLVALAAVEKLRAEKRVLPFPVEIIAFADEEGTRYRTSYLGSRAVAGKFRGADLQRVDAAGVKLADALREFGGNPDAIASCRRARRELLGYVEVHIEQGPVLEQKRAPVGVVTAIAGQSRFDVTFHGFAAHAGTTPMKARRDALCAAAEFITAVEKIARRRRALVSTVGEISVHPGASNVVPGRARVSVDVRSPADTVRAGAVAQLRSAATQSTRRRGCTVSWEIVQETSAVDCVTDLARALAKAAQRVTRRRVLWLPSGAGHDAAVMAAVTPVAMLFVRCKGGISHHPAESVDFKDVALAIDTMGEFLTRLGAAYAEKAQHFSVGSVPS